jgi:hypothetical protein
MMDLSGQVIYLRLTKEGAESLHGFFPPGEGFQARVVAEKGYGLWLVPLNVASDSPDAKDEEVVLLKWGHLYSASFMNPKEGPRRSLGAKK